MDAQSQSGTRDSVTGLVRHMSAPDALHMHPWITPDLFVETRRVWSKEYRREITDDEVIEILANV